MEWFARSNAFRRHDNLKLNIGCGALVQDGWVNVDLYPRTGALYVDVRNGLPFNSDAVVHIHCEHFLEHLSLEEADGFLRECQRVLKLGGTMRIVVPDAEKYMTAYCRKDAAYFGKLIRLGNAATDLDTPIKVINQMFRMGGDHKFAWDFNTLDKQARVAGFSDVTVSSFTDVKSDFAIDGIEEWRPLESLYANLRK